MSESASELLRINIGSGRTQIDGFLNLDITASPGVDIVSDIRTRGALAVKIKPDSVDEYYMSHVLEHFDGHEALTVMENLWHFAKPDARLVCIVPHGQSRHFWRDPDHRRAYLWDGWNPFNQPYWGCDNTGNCGSFGYRGDWQIERVILRPEIDELPYLRQLGDRRWISERADKLWNCVVEMVGILRAVKPARAADESLAEDLDIAIERPDV